MKTIKINLYSFSELSKEAQDKVIEKQYDINVDYNWWESTYEDALNIGLKITSFDIDRANYCNGEFVSGGIDCAHKIEKEHGEKCESYKTAKTFLADYDKLVEKYSDGKVLCTVADENVYEFDGEADELESEFLKSICDYKIILSGEFDYLTSREAILETIEANEYTFEADGTMNNG